MVRITLLALSSVATAQYPPDPRLPQNGSDDPRPHCPCCALHSSRDDSLTAFRERCALSVQDTCSLYAVSGDTCGQSDLDCKYVKYAKLAEKSLKDGTCKDQGYAVKGSTETKKYPVIGDITITKYTKALSAPKKFATGFKLGSIFESNAPIEVAEITQDMRDSAPAALDWTTKGATTAVKDQGQCGSCWAFSVTETVESAVHLATNQAPPILAPQQLTSCDTAEDAGCNGGNPVNAYAYLEKVGGLDVEADYPYTSGKSQESGTCTWTGKKVAKVTDWKYAVPPCQSGDCSNQDEDGLKAVLAAHGPLSIVVNANPWQTYHSGVLDGECGGAMSDLDHAVQLVGYDTTASPPYWKVRNSWATVWGEEGYIRLPMGKNSCGMANLVTYVVASLEEANATSVMV